MLEDAKLLDDYDDGAPRRTWGTTLELNGVTYATSIFWQPLQNSNDYMQEIEDASNTILEGADLFCIKGGKAPQFGICVSHEGYKKGETVAAVALATSLSDVSSFVAVFKTSEGWWYTCVRNDIILSDGDMLFLTEEEAKDQFMSMMAVPDWGKKIAPKEWGIEDTEDLRLSDLIQRGATAKLQKIKGLRGSKLLAVIGISAVVGLWLLSSLIDKIFLAPPKRPVVVPVRPKIAQPAAQVVPIQKPWDNIKNPKQVMQNCYEGISQVASILPPGWKIGTLTCSDNTVATTWRREVGHLSWAEEALKDSNLKFSGYSFSGTGNDLTASLTMSPLETLASPPEKTSTELRNILNEKFQSLGLTITLTDESKQVSQPTPQAPVGKGPQARPANSSVTFRALKFNFRSTHNPTTWVDLLTKYSGLEIRLITYSPNDRVWNYEGAIYVL